MKREVAKRNLTFQLAAVEEETKRQIEQVSADDFNKYYRHVIREEEKYKIYRNLSYNDNRSIE